MALTKKQVSHVAKLAELALSDAELDAMQSDLTAILEHVDQLRALNTDQCPATTHLLVERMPFRADEPRVGVAHDVALQAAPKVLEDGFAVPAFVEES